VALDLTDCQFIGPALPEPFVRFELEKELTRLKLLPKTTGKEGKQLKADWEAYRRGLAQLAVRGGPVRVRNHAVEPIVRHLGYDDIVQQPPVETREGRETGGHLLTNGDNSARLRVWITSLGEDLDAPAKRGRAYRFSHLRIAQRVLLASGERVGLLTNGVELRLLISDPARPDSQVVIPIDPGWKRSRDVPDSFRFLGQHLYEAARLCDENAIDLERRAERAGKAEREKLEAEARKYRQRVIDLPDPDDEIVRYLPSRSPEGEETGISQRKAEALCRRMVAVHCLYGVDKNPLAVELAKLALWLESHAEGMPLTFLDHRLVVGDSLTGPFWDKLIMRPGKPDEPVEGIFHQGLTLALQNRLRDALGCVRQLEATVGISLAEVEEKQRMKAELDRALRPFRIIAAAWSGGVMLGPEKCDDMAYADLLKAVAEKGEIPPKIEPQRLREMIAQGLGSHELLADRDTLYRFLTSAHCVPALAYDIAFPEVFYPEGVPRGRQGFDAVLGNPPWDRIRPAKKEFFASFDIQILGAATARESAKIEEYLLADDRIAQRYSTYVEDFDQQGTIHDVLYKWHEVRLGDIVAGRGNSDLYIIFMERNSQLLARHGITGVVVPSGFHANEGATGLRQLYMKHLLLRYCYSFENRRKLFEIDSRFKFALVVAAANGPTSQFSCAFYLHDDEWLFGDPVTNGRERLHYSMDFVQRTGGIYLSLVELRSKFDWEVADVCYRAALPFDEYCRGASIRFGRECDMNRDSNRFTLTFQVLPAGSDPRSPDTASRLAASGQLILHEGKTFWHYDDRWEAPPRYLVAIPALADRPAYLGRARHFRLGYRAIASSTNERTSVFVLLPPGITCGHSVGLELEPSGRRVADALLILAFANAFVFDWSLRLTVAANVTQYLLMMQPVPGIVAQKGLLAHCALRLTCNHAGYEPLWREQVGDAWREPGKESFTWPVLGSDDERWAVRAAIDAVVADAYGLSRDQYEHILSTFSHASYRKAPELCLAKFDELKQIGLDAFTGKYDPYHDIPLNENLPQPVIELPIPTDEAKGTQGGLF
jgi:hypothetical protein